MRDIDIKCDDGNFKLRVSAIIVKNNKILLTESTKKDGYCFPGGHVEFGETASETIIREVKEEIQINVKIQNLYCICENIYIDKTDKINQEINYCYLLEPLENIAHEEFITEEIDKGILKKHIFRWIPINDLSEVNLKPNEMVCLLQENLNYRDKIIFIDNRR